MSLAGPSEDGGCQLTLQQQPCKHPSPTTLIPSSPNRDQQLYSASRFQVEPKTWWPAPICISVGKVGWWHSSLVPSVQPVPAPRTCSEADCGVVWLFLSGVENQENQDDGGDILQILQQPKGTSGGCHYLVPRLSSRDSSGVQIPGYLPEVTNRGSPPTLLPAAGLPFLLLLFTAPPFAPQG